MARVSMLRATGGEMLLGPGGAKVRVERALRDAHAGKDLVSTRSTAPRV